MKNRHSPGTFVSGVALVVGGASIGYFVSQVGDSPQQSRGSPEGDLSQIGARLAAVERQVSQLWLVGHEQVAPRLSQDSGDDDEILFGTGSTHVPVQVATDTYENEQGASAWGNRLATATMDAFPIDSFFGRFGGDLSTDCKQTTCRLEWFMPHPDGLAPDERDEMLSMAAFELAALASRGGSETGRFDIEWNLSGPKPSVAIYLMQRK